MRRKAILILTIVVGMFFGIVGMASANQRFLPSGIDGVSPAKAKAQVLDYAALNDEYAQLLASQSGASSFNRSDYRSRGYSTAKSNTLNTSLTAGGAIAKTTGATGTKTLVLVNIKTGRTVEVMVRCGNVRVRKGGPCHCKPIRITKVNKILVNKKFTKTVERSCPSGQKVTVTVNGRVKGWVRGKITGKVIGSAKLYLSQQVNLQVTAQIDVRCGTAPVVPTTPGPTASNDCPQGQTKNNQGICVAVAVQCKANEVKDSAGNCVTQTNSAEQNCKAIGGTFNGATQLCTIIQINANCSNVTIVNGSGNVVSTSQEGNCNSSPPPPVQKCPDGRPVPPGGCDRPPVVNIMGGAAHTYVGGNVAIWIETSDPDGDAQTLEVVGDSFAHISGVIPSSVRWDGTACPSGKQCWRATLWGDKVGTAKVVASVTAGGKTVVSQPAYVPIKPDDFG